MNPIKNKTSLSCQASPAKTARLAILAQVKTEHSTLGALCFTKQ